MTALQEQEALTNAKFQLEFKRLKDIKDDLQDIKLQQLRNKLFMNRFKLKIGVQQTVKEKVASGLKERLAISIKKSLTSQPLDERGIVDDLPAVPNSLLKNGHYRTISHLRSSSTSLLPSHTKTNTGEADLDIKNTFKWLMQRGQEKGSSRNSPHQSKMNESPTVAPQIQEAAVEHEGLGRYFDMHSQSLKGVKANKKPPLNKKIHGPTMVTLKKATKASEDEMVVSYAKDFKQRQDQIKNKFVSRPQYSSAVRSVSTMEESHDLNNYHALHSLEGTSSLLSRVKQVLHHRN